jgi:nitrate/TMAO reductase-like tetraheme cytochrome c subunit
MSGLVALGALAMALASHAAGAATGGAVATDRAAGAELAKANLVELHAGAGKLGSKQCLACHARIATGVSLDKKTKTYHRLHLESKLTTPKDCADCHQAVDLRNGSAATLRKQVDPEICAGCHSGGLEGAKTLYSR